MMLGVKKRAVDRFIADDLSTLKPKKVRKELELQCNASSRRSQPPLTHFADFVETPEPSPFMARWKQQSERLTCAARRTTGRHGAGPASLDPGAAPARPQPDRG